MTSALQIRRIGPTDAAAVLAASQLFDAQPRDDWTAAFLGKPGNHLFIAYVAEIPAGFVSGIEVAHPDKATEMMLYELGVGEPFRRRGIGRALVLALRDAAIERDCCGMWVPLSADNEAAVATYRSAGAQTPETSAIMAWSFDDR